jgi:tetratricopeptide (TPR) repeat protein
MLKARMAFKDANTAYAQQDYRVARTKYEEALKLDEVEAGPAGAYFFLANTADNLYRPGRKGEAENDKLLALAADNYKKAAEQSTDPKIKKLSLDYLVAAYNNPDKLNDPGQAEPLVQRMIQIDPTDVANYFGLAKIYEDNGDYEHCEQTLMKAKEIKPNDPAVYMQLAGYYDRQGDFDKLIDALQQRAQREPNNPEVYYTMATYYWGKASRDFRLPEAEKKKIAESGVESVDKAISLKNDYSEALTYKGLLLRVQANLEKDSGKQQQLIKEAEQLQAKAEELRKQKQAGAQAVAAAPAKK